MQIGDPQREYFIEPLELPEPLRVLPEPEPEETPVEQPEEPEKEPVKHGD